MAPIILTLSMLGVAVTGSYLKAQKALISDQHENRQAQTGFPLQIDQIINQQHFVLQSRTALTNSELYLAHTYLSELCSGSLTALRLQRNGEGAALLAATDQDFETRYLFQSRWYPHYPALRFSWNRFINAANSLVPLSANTEKDEVWAVTVSGSCKAQVWPL